jgi:hypothetical protein
MRLMPDLASSDLRAARRGFGQPSEEQSKRTAQDRADEQQAEEREHQLVLAYSPCSARAALA